MKKLSKKQKLIEIIFIILITIIIAIVITTNIMSSNNNQVASEGYSATTAKVGSSLISNYILNGVTIGGITGTLEVLNTSDATATAEEILWGKTAYVNGVKITGKKGDLDTVKGDETSNSEVYDKYGNKVIVPSGFKVVNPDDDVTDGIVIEDVSAGNENTKGSEFVWVPVGNVITDMNGSVEKIELARYTFDNAGNATIVQLGTNWNQEVTIDYLYKELSTSSYGNKTAKNLEQFINRTLAANGFYIGRYEAGDAYATSESRTSKSSDSNPVVSKRLVYPYNYVTQGQASNLARTMYNNKNFESDLINSYTWDTTIKFIQTFSDNKSYSKTSSLPDYELDRCGYVSGTDESLKDVKCNIFAMAGNVYEFSTETVTSNDVPNSYRGGTYLDTSTSTSGRSGDGNINDVQYGFRVILYV